MFGFKVVVQKEREGLKSVYEAYQKLKKSRISLSSVLAEMFLTSTVVADILKVFEMFVVTCC